MNSSKKLTLAAAILAGGLCLALFFAAPRASYVPPQVPDAAQPGPIEGLPPLFVDAAGYDTTRLVPEVTLPELPPAPEPLAAAPSPAATAPPALETPASTAAETPSPSKPSARLVGIQSQPPGGNAGGQPLTPTVSLPQVSVQVSTGKPVYATVEYPDVVSAAALERVPRATIETEVDNAHSGAGGITLDEFAPWADAAPSSSLRTHIIIDGDSLPRLAARYLDDPQRGEEIFQLNQGVLTDPELLPIGLELKIPPLPLRPRTFAGSEVESGAATAQSGLVPVYEIPGSTNGTPRAKLLRPMPASYPGHQP